MQKIQQNSQQDNQKYNQKSNQQNNLNNIIFKINKELNLPRNCKLIVSFNSLDTGTQLLLTKNRLNSKIIISYAYFFYKDSMSFSLKNKKENNINNTDNTSNTNNIITGELVNANDIINADFPMFHNWIKSIIKLNVPQKIRKFDPDNRVYNNSNSAFKILKESPFIKSIDRDKEKKKQLIKEGINYRRDEFNSLNDGSQRLIKFINARVGEGLLVNSIYLYKNFLKNRMKVPVLLINDIKIKKNNEGIVFVNFINFINERNYNNEFIKYVQEKIRKGFNLEDNGTMVGNKNIFNEINITTKNSNKILDKTEKIFNKNYFSDIDDEDLKL